MFSTNDKLLIIVRMKYRLQTECHDDRSQLTHRCSQGIYLFLNTYSDRWFCNSYAIQG